MTTPEPEIANAEMVCKCGTATPLVLGKSLRCEKCNTLLIEKMTEEKKEEGMYYLIPQ